MEIKDLNICLITDKVEACKEFYQKYFDAKITFDCGWYIILTLTNGEKEFPISIMAPQAGEPLFSGGVTLNLSVEAVDKEYEQLQKKELKIEVPIKDNPWGDRSFVVCDPIGTRLYIYTDTKPTQEYANAYTN